MYATYRNKQPMDYDAQLAAMQTEGEGGNVCGNCPGRMSGETSGKVLIPSTGLQMYVKQL